MNIEEQYDKIYRYCWYKLKNREAAEDITQEAFLRLLNSGGYRDTGRSLQYLYTVARNLCTDEFRRIKPDQLPEEVPVPGPEEKTVTSMALKEALDELSPEDRELLLLRYVNEVRVSVLARLCGVSRFALYRRLAGITGALKKKLGGSEFFE